MKVYLITDNDSLFKIGRSVNTENRLKSLQTSNGRKLTILYEVECKHGTKVESIMHRRYSSKRINGEWFQLSNEECNNFINDVKSIDENLSYIFENSTLKNPLGY